MQWLVSLHQEARPQSIPTGNAQISCKDELCSGLGSKASGLSMSSVLSGFTGISLGQEEIAED
jgi:hypothetical protein